MTRHDSNEGIEYTNGCQLALNDGGSNNDN